MLDLLHAAERALPDLLNTDGWVGVRVDYHPPFVDRAWRPWGENRIYLHRIYGCAAEDALFHPHPWPSAMRIQRGRYEMGLGYGVGDVVPPVAAHVIAGAGAEYDMTDRDAWHYVRPLDEPVLTLMVTGKPWNRSAPKSDGPLAALDPSELLATFRALYPTA